MATIATHKLEDLEEHPSAKSSRMPAVSTQQFADQNQGLRSAINADRERLYSEGCQKVEYAP